MLRNSSKNQLVPVLVYLTEAAHPRPFPNLSWVRTGPKAQMSLSVKKLLTLKTPSYVKEKKSCRVFAKQFFISSFWLKLCGASACLKSVTIETIMYQNKRININPSLTLQQELASELFYLFLFLT